ncbi:uncharacterized protein LOC102351824 [Latimeria chalumnae]|uniref:uncharacterized protein LOC102351824 n=1 Tax=Latimeria chalumnae TaxID=7897 RepID=UPI00313E7213
MHSYIGEEKELSFVFPSVFSSSNSSLLDVSGTEDILRTRLGEAGLQEETQEVPQKDTAVGLLAGLQQQWDKELGNVIRNLADTKGEDTMQLPQGITVKFQETQDLGLEHLFSAPTLEQPAPGEPRRQEACQRDQEKEAEFNGCECKQEEVILVQEVKKPPGLSPEMKQNHSEFGGGIPPEPFPYLDVLRTKGPAEVHTPSPEAQEEMTFLSEKQGSLIALAWTTRSEDGQTQPTGEDLLLQ